MDEAGEMNLEVDSKDKVMHIEIPMCSESAPLPMRLTSTKRIRDSYPDFRSNLDLDPQCLPDRSQNVVDVGVSHFAKCRENRAGDCIRNANKSSRIPYSSMVREVEKWFGICIRNRITPKVNQFFRSVGPPMPNQNVKFQWNRLIMDARSA